MKKYIKCLACVFLISNSFAGEIKIQQVFYGSGSNFAVADAQARRYKGAGNVINTQTSVENGRVMVKIVVEQKVSQSK